MRRKILRHESFGGLKKRKQVNQPIYYDSYWPRLHEGFEELALLLESSGYSFQSLKSSLRVSVATSVHVVYLQLQLRAIGFEILAGSRRRTRSTFSGSRAVYASHSLQHRRCLL